MLFSPKRDTRYMAPAANRPRRTLPSPMVCIGDALTIGRGRWLQRATITGLAAAAVATVAGGWAVGYELQWWVTAPLRHMEAIQAVRNSGLPTFAGIALAMALVGGPAIAAIASMTVSGAADGSLRLGSLRAAARSYQGAFLVGGLAGLAAATACVHWSLAALWPIIWIGMWLSLVELTRCREGAIEAIRGALSILRQHARWLMVQTATSLSLVGAGAIAVAMLLTSGCAGADAIHTLLFHYHDTHLRRIVPQLLMALIGVPVGLMGLRLIPVSFLSLAVAYNGVVQAELPMRRSAEPPAPLFVHELSGGE